MIDVSNNNAVYYYHFDGLGSVVALSDINNVVVDSYSYDVFGEPNTMSTIGNPYMFTGRRFDNETSNYYYRARIYKPGIGRFLQPDPIGYDDGLNMYAYVGNNPVNYFDPYGLCKERSFGEKLWEGDYVGTQYGQEATDYWVARAVVSETWYGKSGNYLMGGLAALWTPDTWKETAVVLGTAGISSGSGAISKVATKTKVITRSVKGADGATSQIIKTTSRLSGKTVKVIHKVTSDSGKVIHQHTKFSRIFVP